MLSSRFKHVFKILAVCTIIASTCSMRELHHGTPWLAAIMYVCGVMFLLAAKPISVAWIKERLCLFRRKSVTPLASSQPSTITYSSSFSPRTSKHLP